MEAADCAAGNDDEERRPYGASLRMLACEECIKADVRQNVISLRKKGDGKADGHENEQDCEERVNLADDLVYREDGCADVVGENNYSPDPVWN